jgi:hypothetical protein
MIATPAAARLLTLSLPRAVLKALKGTDSIGRGEGFAQPWV